MRENDLEFFKSIGVTLYNTDGKYDRYSGFCCEEAIMIAMILETEEKIIEFSKADNARQKEMVSCISEEHSGHTFNMACKLAVAYLPMLKVNMRDNKINDIVKPD
jgi:predicted lactoylglutathione lyase